MNNELIIESLFFVLSNPLKQSDLKKIFDNGDTPMFRRCCKKSE